MKLRFTCVTSSDVARLIGEVGVWLEDSLAQKFDSREFGGDIEQFVVVFVAVDSDADLNERFATSHDKGGKYKDFRTGEYVKFVGIAVRLDPESLVDFGLEQAKVSLAGLVRIRLRNPMRGVPSEFRKDEFLREIDFAISQLLEPPQDDGVTG